jgi:hypothetical protein
MKFDSSASDNISAIWAFTFALMQTSFESKGNHPKIMIFDEPAQQSMIPKDMPNFLKSLENFNQKFQVIIGKTIKSIYIISSI